MNNTIQILQLSSMKKIFLTEDLSNLSEESGKTALKGERVSYQILYTGGSNYGIDAFYTISHDKRIKTKVRKVGNVPCEFPARKGECDEYYLSTKPGLYPDVLYPIEENEWFRILSGSVHSLFITAEIPENIEPGIYPVCIKIKAGDTEVEKIFKINVMDAILPKQDLTYTQWFHADCISSYYKLSTLSEEHWDMIEKFIEMAAYTGVSLILTPLYTPPLDTVVGGERPTVQLVDITYKNDKYSFGFEKLKRWIAICKKYGIYQFEMPHLFTQWGTGCTPKIEAQTDEGKKNIFGWHIKADDVSYHNFLKCFIPELIKALKDEGVYENTYFHISDEPDYEKCRELYKAERETVKDLIPDHKIIDAMSHFEFLEEGLIEKPIPITSSADTFIEKGYELEWAYYCCLPGDKGYSNKFIAMPSGRNRIIGVQLYKYGINKFLHWGYNFYYSQLSRRVINPFLVTDADEGFQSGDAFSVYPGEDGPLESIRSVVFYEGIQDLRACKLLETYIGRDEVIKIIEETGEIRFNQFPRTDEGVVNIRERINIRLAEVLDECSES